MDELLELVLRVGERVFAHLDRAQVFSPDGTEAAASDELAAL